MLHSALRRVCTLGLSRLGRACSGSLADAQTRLRTCLPDVQIGCFDHCGGMRHCARGFASAGAEAAGGKKKNGAEEKRKQDGVEAEKGEEAESGALGGEGAASQGAKGGDGDAAAGASASGDGAEAEGPSQASGEDGDGGREGIDAGEEQELREELRLKTREMDALQEKVEELQDKHLRAYADLENMRQRAARQSEVTKKYAVQNFVKDLLEVADTLERATETIPPEFSNIEEQPSTGDDDQLKMVFKGLLDGVRLTDKMLVQVFQKNGVEKYRPVNEHFDPHLHNALFELEDPEKEPGTIAVVSKV
ncbi:unnamed protein product [Ostreobium quekettii]|uniref:GrpE protein homolog n=1 Tax=Ostreobium quekettii TaxID=121088 RepID=A0A8S1IT80_9CHLO|nr:unnamed protein product [Ostreobium quekettii]